MQLVHLGVSLPTPKTIYNQAETEHPENPHPVEKVDPFPVPTLTMSQNKSFNEMHLLRSIFNKFYLKNKLHFEQSHITFQLIHSYTIFTIVMQSE